MSRTEIIRQVAKRIYGNTGENEIQKSTQICDTIVDIFIEALMKKEKILWKGFMSVEVVEHGERKGKNPQSNEVVTFPPVKSIKCKMSKLIKDMVNGK